MAAIAGLIIVALGIIGCTIVALVIASEFERQANFLGPAVGLLLGYLAAYVAVTSLAMAGLFFGVGLLASWAVAVTVTGGGGILLSRKLDHQLGVAIADIRLTLRKQRVVLGLVGLLAVAQSAVSVGQLYRSGDVGWDASGYHVAITGSIIQSGSLFDSLRLIPWLGYPVLVETQAALIGVTLSSQRATGLVQLPYWVWLLCFIGLIVERLGSRFGALAAVIAVAAIPTMWLQTRVLYVDVAYAALMVAAIVSVVVAVQLNDRMMVLLASVFVGGMFATKFSPAMVPIALTVVGLAVFSRRIRTLLPLILIILAIPSAGVIVRNVVKYQEPFYPVALVTSAPAQGPPFSLAEMAEVVDTSQRLGVFDDAVGPILVHEYLTSPVGSLMELRPIGAVNQRLRFNYDARLGGFGAGMLFLAAAAAAIAVVQWTKARQILPLHRLSRASPLTFVLGIVLLSVLTAATTQALWWPRYALGLASCVAIVCGLTVSRLPRGASLALLGAVGAISMLTIAQSEWIGGFGKWGRLPISADDATSPLTVGFEPLYRSGARTVAMVRESPSFPGGLWGPSWDIAVTSIASVDGMTSKPCLDAYLVLAADVDSVTSMLDSQDCGDFTHVAWTDREGVLRTERVWLISERSAD